MTVATGSSRPEIFSRSSRIGVVDPRHRASAMKRRGFPSLLATIALLAACAREPAPPLPSEVYVWQRVWTPALLDAIDRHRDTLTGIRVQALAVPGRGGTRTIAVPLTALAARRVPVRAVIRIEGQRLLEDGAALIAMITALSRQWPAQGIDLRGVEIDYDCATARLPRYGEWLALLRRELPANVPLSITALPSWLASESLATTLAPVQQVVLQVHGVDDPHGALFDTARAAGWVATWSRRTKTPFIVSLPTYATRAAFDAGGILVAIESEATIAHAGVASRELVADPRAVAALVDALDRERPARLEGLIWFRLPLPGDRRTWRDTTLAALLARDLPPRRWRTTLHDARDVVLHNDGALDEVLPARIAIDGDCDAGDGVGGYTLTTGESGTHALRRDADGVWIRAGNSRILGWLHCREPGAVRFHVDS
jgi:hypothetical protein